MRGNKHLFGIKKIAVLGTQIEAEAKIVSQLQSAEGRGFLWEKGREMVTCIEERSFYWGWQTELLFSHTQLVTDSIFRESTIVNPCGQSLCFSC